MARKRNTKVTETTPRSSASSNQDGYPGQDSPEILLRNNIAKISISTASQEQEADEPRSSPDPLALPGESTSNSSSTKQSNHLARLHNFAHAASPDYPTYPPILPPSHKPKVPTICVSTFLNPDSSAILLEKTMPTASSSTNHNHSKAVGRRRPSFTPSLASTTAGTKPATAERNIDNVVLGNILFRAWYPSYHVKEIVGKEVVDGKTQMLERLYVCNHCFKYSKELMGWLQHLKTCPRGEGGSEEQVPGEQIYTDENGTWSVWEVDGEVDTLYCQNLSLFAKLFLDNKSVFYSVTDFTYFLLVHTDLSSGAQTVIGFFSKEKMSWDNNNLACILIFPPWQRKGLGALLIAVSYEISRREGVMGGPEKPISSLGKKGYVRFWSGEIARWILEVGGGGKEGGEKEKKKGSANGNANALREEVSLDRISKETWICVDDCLSALREMGVATVAPGPKGKEGVGKVRIEKEAVRRWAKDNKISLVPVIDSAGFKDGYGYKESEEIEEEAEEEEDGEEDGAEEEDDEDMDE